MDPQGGLLCWKCQPLNQEGNTELENHHFGATNDTLIKSEIFSTKNLR
jgi:hypothetical protein